jgi:hypothetical protein
MDFNSEEIGWPHDTVIVSFHGNIQLLVQTVLALTTSGHVFVVSPLAGAIAMSADAAREIGVTVDHND